MSRRPQTCADCARRKIKCDKVIPCTNCTKRGAAHLCRRAEVAHSVERRRISNYGSPGAIGGTAGGGGPGLSSDSSPTMTRSPIIEEPLNERMFSLVTTLSERVKHLESKLVGLDSDSQKRPASDVDPVEPREFLGTPQAYVEEKRKPPKVPRIRSPDGLRTARQDDSQLENDSNSGQIGSDPEAEDAATVLEFLAWGRLKDSNLTTGIREPPSIHDPLAHAEKDVIQSAQAWGVSPSSIPASQMSMDTLQIPQIQEMLPEKSQVVNLLEFHDKWLLYLHGAFHTMTFRRELEQFYTDDQGLIKITSTGLQWTSLLFAIICGSMTCAQPAEVVSWGFRGEDQSILAKRWYQASVECLNAGRYQQYHSVYGIQAIASITISAHILGFSNSQSVLLASAVRIAQSLGLHRLGAAKRPRNEGDGESTAEITQKELGRRIWQQLTMQDWFSVPFSETCCVNPLHFSTKQPMHCDEDMQPLPESEPSLMSYCNFLFRIAALMPALLDQSFAARTIEARYEQVLTFDRMMRELVISKLPSCLNSQTPIDPSWPPYVTVARRVLTITSAHKIIMIHRRFLGMSFHDPRFAFTRRTCLAAAKTIINEMQQDFPEETPIIWTNQAFSVAAAIILALDNFNRHQSAREYEEHRRLITDTISMLSNSVAISSIAARGTRLLSELLAEEQNHTQHNTNINSQNGVQDTHDSSNFRKTTDKSLNVAAFVKKFCETDQSSSGDSPIATQHIPLWLQQDSSVRSSSVPQQNSEEIYTGGRYATYSVFPARSSSPPLQQYTIMDRGYQYPQATHRHHELAPNSFTHNLPDSFDIRTVNWFDDLLGLAPSNSI